MKISLLAPSYVNTCASSVFLSSYNNTVFTQSVRVFFFGYFLISDHVRNCKVVAVYRRVNIDELV